MRTRKPKTTSSRRFGKSTACPSPKQSPSRLTNTRTAPKRGACTMSVPSPTWRTTTPDVVIRPPNQRTSSRARRSRVAQQSPPSRGAALHRHHLRGNPSSDVTGRREASSTLTRQRWHSITPLDLTPIFHYLLHFNLNRFLIPSTPWKTKRLHIAGQTREDKSFFPFQTG